MSSRSIIDLMIHEVMYNNAKYKFTYWCISQQYKQHNHVSIHNVGTF
jgi:deoxycytidylate deaminase